MQFAGNIDKRLISAYFGPNAEVAYQERRGRRIFYPVTDVKMSYAAALQRLRAVHGPLARFKRYDQAGVEGWAVQLGVGVDRKLVLKPGPPDWAELLHAALM